jgi:hypothetical protein
VAEEKFVPRGSCCGGYGAAGGCSAIEGQVSKRVNKERLKGLTAV